VVVECWGSNEVSASGWSTKCHTIDCARNTFLLLQKHLTSGTELILIGWKIVPNEEHVQCDHRFAPQPLANEPLHSSQLFDTSLQKACGTASLCWPWAALHFLASLATKGGQGGLFIRTESLSCCHNILSVITSCYTVHLVQLIVSVLIKQFSIHDPKFFYVFTRVCHPTYTE